MRASHLRYKWGSFLIGNKLAQVFRAKIQHPKGGMQDVPRTEETVDRQSEG